MKSKKMTKGKNIEVRDPIKIDITSLDDKRLDAIMLVAKAVEQLASALSYPVKVDICNNHFVSRGMAVNMTNTTSTTRVVREQ